ncbi:flavin reductase family protein [Streptomyces indicus]|uniref:Flavin reductase like domain-containing protein n=1 Tax=Streptomyces indicus TaxID=417292 RepID=A0A1G8T6F4_9ACTN|nr:flavin reductase family protein [Streptomyces indicus]SDJ36941.1 Flavin reductase like domain-containing protein [Streptomyces indicus]
MDAFIDRLDYPLYVVTASADGERAGCLVGFASQCSIEPVRFMVWLSKANRTWRVARTADHLGVHLLAPEQKELAELFGGRTGDEVDKFARTAWAAGHAGVPVLTEASAWFVGRVEQHLDGGDHVGCLLCPVDSGTRPDAPHSTLRLSDAGDISPGHPAD